MECQGLQWRLVKPILFFSAVFLISSISAAEQIPQRDWTFSLGLGAFHGTAFAGSNETETTALLDFEVVWKDRAILTPEGLSINYYDSDSVTLSAIFSFGDSREDSLNASLNGLGDIDASVTVALGSAFDSGLFHSYANVIKHHGGTEGTQVIAGVETAFPLRILTGNTDVADPKSIDEEDGPTFLGPIIIAGLSTEWADDNYNSGFFGVNAAQAAGSGLPQYTAGAGFNAVTLELGVLHPLNQTWSVEGFVAYGKIIGDPKGSPIVSDDNFRYAGGLIRYHF